MPPQEKLPKSRSNGKGKTENPHCPYCDFHICWRHGFYERKGHHRSHEAPRNDTVVVCRFLCRSPVCEHTFSRLPVDTLPYCRFFLSGLLSIVQDLAHGEPVHWIARFRWDTTEPVIYRAIDRIEKVTPWLKQQFQEQTGRVKNSFQELIGLLQKHFSWFRLTRNWFHHFYPLRVAHILNPHNLRL